MLISFVWILLQAGGTDPRIVNVVFIVGLVLVFYFLMLRPQQKKQKQQKLFTESLKKGDAVVTVGGMHGKIFAFEDNAVLVEVDKGVKLKFEKSSLSYDNTKLVLGKDPIKK